MDRLGLTIMLSGGAALGAYQAGAMSALLVMCRELSKRDGDAIRIEAIGGASAGALVGLFSAHAALEGIDGHDLLHEAWVERVNLKLLRGKDTRSPLSMARLESGIRELLLEYAPGLVSDRAYRQKDPIAFHAALTGLQGLTYSIRGLRREGAVTGLTFSDWGRFTLEAGNDPEALFQPEGSSPIDFVLASAANPAAFAARLLDREDDAQMYRAHGISNFPDSGHIWYTDGGLLQSQPVGRVIAAARALHGRDESRRKLTLMIDPRSEGPSGAGHWTDIETAPGWASSLTRSLSILPSQILYDDLRRVAKDNSRLGWAAAFVEAIEPHLDHQGEAALRELIEIIDEDRKSNRSDEPAFGDRYRGDADTPDLGQLLRRVIDEVAGLSGKETVDVDVITPLIMAEGESDDVKELLAGEILGDFGGFLSRELRESDFALGYASASRWIVGAMDAFGLDADAAEEVVAAVDDRSPGDWRAFNRGRVEPDDLSLGSRADLVRLAARFMKVAMAETFSGPTEDLRRALDGVRSRIPGLTEVRRRDR